MEVERRITGKAVFKAALVGCGAIGSRYDEKPGNETFFTHAGMYNHLPVFDLTAAVDPDLERLKTAGRFWKIENLYPDIQTMLENEQLDTISIATPDDTHYSLIKQCLDINPPRLIFSEKPLSDNPRDGEDLIQLCREKGVHLIVDYIRRWDRTHRNIRHFIRSGQLGRIRTVTGHYVRGLTHNGCHMINLLHFFFGRILSVKAVGNANLGSLKDDPSLNLYMRMACGAETHIMALDRPVYGFSIFEMDIFGESGRLGILDGGKTFEYFAVEKHPDFSNFLHLTRQSLPWLESTYDGAMLMAGKDIADYLDGDLDKTTNEAVESLSDLAVIDAAHRSALNQGSVEDVLYPKTDRPEEDNLWRS